MLFQDYASVVPNGRVVVIDESGIKMGMVPSRARAPRGQRAYSSAPYHPGTPYTLLAALRREGITAPWLVSGTVNTEVFRTYLEEVLGPTLQPGDLVVMDNVPFHKAPSIEAAIRSRGAEIWWLPSYSPDLSPIELAFSKLKQFLRRAKVLTFDALLDALSQALAAISDTDALSWFIHCGFFNVDRVV